MCICWISPVFKPESVKIRLSVRKLPLAMVKVKGTGMDRLAADQCRRWETLKPRMESDTTEKRCWSTQQDWAGAFRGIVYKKGPCIFKKHFLNFSIIV